jgi:uncharacterized protein (DUF433 family)
VRLLEIAPFTQSLRKKFYLCGIMNTPNTWLQRITVDPGICGGRPCIRGMRIRVIDVLDLLASGLTQDQILEELPDLEREDIEAVLRYASSKFDHPVIAA